MSSGAEDDHPLDTPMTPASNASSRYPSNRKIHLCPHEGCIKAFNRPARLAEHLRSHTNERIFHCEHEGCSKTFLRQSHLNHHVKSAHTTIRDYVCPREECDKAFATGSRLRRHLAAHEGRDKYRCTEYPPCGETFRKHTTLQRHVIMVHLNQKPFVCQHVDPVSQEQCTQAFDTAGHLRSHESRIHGDARFRCTECSNVARKYGGGVLETSFYTFAQLRQHIRSVHPPICPDCGIECLSSRELRQHVEIIHGGLSLEDRKVFPCDHPGCERSFTKKGNLNVHVRTVHEGEKRFVCGQTDLSGSRRLNGWSGENACGKQYSSKLALEEHVRTAHLGMKHARAARRQQLGLDPKPRSRPMVSDLAMLTGEGYAEESGRPIPCLLANCPYRFHRNYDLWMHMGAKHQMAEADTQILLMQRAMTDGEQLPSDAVAPFVAETLPAPTGTDMSVIDPVLTLES